MRIQAKPKGKSYQVSQQPHIHHEYINGFDIQTSSHDKEEKNQMIWDNLKNLSRNSIDTIFVIRDVFSFKIHTAKRNDIISIWIIRKTCTV